MSKISLTPSEIIAASALYGGSYDDTIAQMVAANFVKSAAIQFPNMHAATSWANANGILGKVNVIWHPFHLDEKVVIRYAIEGD